MEQPADPHAGRELVQRVEDQEHSAGPQTAGGMARPRAAHAEEHRQSGERDPPGARLGTLDQRRTSDHEPDARQDADDARTKEARPRDLGDGPSARGIAEDGELDPQREPLGDGDDRGPERCQPEAAQQARARSTAVAEGRAQQE